MKSDSSTFKPALMLMSGRTLAFLVTFLVPFVLISLFTPLEYGTYKQFFVIVYMLYGIGQMGMAESLFFFLPSFPQNAGRYVCNAMLLLGGIGVCVIAAFTMFSGYIAKWADDGDASPKFLVYAAVFLFLMLVSCVLEIVLISTKRYRWAAVSYAVSDLVRAASLVIPALVFRTVEAVIVGGLVFCVLRLVATIIHIRREFGREFRPDWRLLRQQLGYALPFALAVGVEVVQANYHQLAVSLYFGVAMLAVYSIGCLNIPIVDFISTPASNVMMVRMGEELREGRERSLLPIWHDTTRKLALVFFPLVGVLVANATSLIQVLTREKYAIYAASVPIFMLWSLSVLTAAFQTDGVLRVFAETRFLFIMNAVRLGLIVVSMHWFLRHFELIGAVLVTLAGLAVAKSMALVRVKQLLRTSVSRVLPWKNLGGIFTAAVIAAAPAALVAATQAPPIARLIAGGAAYAATYAVIVWFCRLLTPPERHAILRRITKRRDIEARSMTAH